MKKIALISFLLLIASAISSQNNSIAEWQTSLGMFRCELFDDMVPITVQNFIDLSDENFYDGLIFHRVIEGFVIQDGDPLGTGYGGPGYTIPDEFHPDLSHDAAGVLAMANTGQPNSAGSQYYITLAPQTQLDGGYAIFGGVIEGLDVVLAIGSVPTNANDQPITPVYIDSIRILNPQIESYYPEEFEQEIDVGTNLYFMAVSYDENISYSWLVNDIDQEVNDFLFDYTFTEAGYFEVKVIVSNNSDYPSQLIWDITVYSTEINDISESAEVMNLTNFPNPFHSSTTISFLFTENKGHTDLNIFNIKGQKVRRFRIKNYDLGIINVCWDGTDQNGDMLKTGIYFAGLLSNGKQVFRKMILLN